MWIWIFVLMWATTLAQHTAPPGSLLPSCVPTNSTPGLTWCEHNNPFILSDFLSRNSSDLSANFSLGVTCEAIPGKLHRSCSAIQQIRTGTAGIVESETEPASAKRYVIYTDRNGRMLFVNFNTNQLEHQAKMEVHDVRFFDVASVLRNDTQTGSIVEDMCMVLANSTSLSLGVMAGDKTSEIATCHLNFQFVEGLTLQHAVFFPHFIHDPNAIVNFAWAVQNSTTYTFPNGTRVPLNNYYVYITPARQNTIADYIRRCPGDPPLGVEVGTVVRHLRGDVRFDFVHNIISNLTILAAYTTKALNIFHVGYFGQRIQNANQTFWNHEAGLLPESCSNFSFYNATTNEYEERTRRPSTVYCAPPGWSITSVSSFTPDKWDDISEYKRDLWFAIGMKSDDGTSTYLRVFDLPEILEVNESTSAFDNPLNLPDSFGTPSYPCPDFLNYAYMWGACHRRRVVEQYFDGSDEITQVELRGVRLYMNERESTVPTIGPISPAGQWNASSWSWRLPSLPTVEMEHAEIFVARGRMVTVFTLYTTNNYTTAVDHFEKQNDIAFIGDVRYMYASENAQHLFVAVTREEWELDSQERYKAICDALSAGPGGASDPFLAALAPQCTAMPPQDVNLNSFAQYASDCSFGMYCPTLDRLDVRIPQPTMYADRPAVQLPCPQGYYCPLGVKSACPPGFYCPETGMVFPLRCPTSPAMNTTCAEFGLPAVLPCPPGVVCSVNHIPGLPTPPGFIMPLAPAPRTDFEECAPGMWCPLGASEALNFVVANVSLPNGTVRPITRFMCPEETFCPSPSVLAPTECLCPTGGNISDGNTTQACDGRMMYCPGATTTVSWCPAGYYCTAPNASTSCVPSQYCPPGTFAPNLCPKGFYCAEPANKVECPYGHYCPEGTIAAIKCNFLTVCPAGSVSESRTFLAPFMLAVVVGGVLIAFSIFARLRKKRDDEARAAKLQRELHGTDEASHSASQLETESLRSETSLLVQNSPRGAPPALPSSRFKTPEIQFKGMGLTLNVGEAKGKRVLDNVTGVIPAGSFVAVMGPSGSGKSTFMHTLAGKAFYGTRDGTVLVNGDEVDLTAFAKVIGFVKQDDIMHRELTVAETLLFNARARYDDACGQEAEGIASAMLRAMDLEHVQDTCIGDEKKRGISGGQRKRVNIGMELVALPCILFLDEPTSGLDSSSSMGVCKALRALAESGITVIVVIHQPRYEIFELFHKVMLLAKGGKLVYFGDPRQALGYFESSLHVKCPPHVNPPDFFMDAISGDMDGAPSIEAMVGAWNRHTEAQPPPPLTLPTENRGLVLAREAGMKQMPSFFTQVRLFTARAAVQLSRDLLWFFTDLVLVLVAGFFLGLVFSKSTYRPPLPGQIVNKSLESFHGSAPPMLTEFFDRPIDDPIISEASLTCMALGMTGVTAALRVFGPEEIVYWREASAGMSTNAYFVAKNFTHVLFILLSPLLYLAPFLTFVSARASFLAYYRVCVALQFATTGLGYLVSTVVPGGLAQLAGVVSVLVFAMFGGCRPTLVEIKDMFALLQVMPYVSYIRWGQEAMYLEEIHEWKDVPGVNVQPSLDLFGYHLDDYSTCVGAVVAFGIGFRVAALVAMHLMHRDQKH